MILDVSNSQSAVLWAGKQTNITGDMVSAYDSKYPVK